MHILFIRVRLFICVCVFSAILRKAITGASQDLEKKALQRQCDHPSSALDERFLAVYNSLNPHDRLGIFSGQKDMWHRTSMTSSNDFSPTGDFNVLFTHDDQQQSVS